MSIRNYHHSLRNNPEESSYQERNIIPDRELTVSVHTAQVLFQIQPAILTPSEMNSASDVSHKLSREVTFSSLDVRGYVHHSVTCIKIQQDATVCQNLLFHIYIKLNMFRATHRPSSGA